MQGANSYIVIKNFKLTVSPPIAPGISMSLCLVSICTPSTFLEVTVSLKKSFDDSVGWELISAGYLTQV